MNRAYLALLGALVPAFGGCDEAEHVEGLGVVVAASGTTSSQAFARYRRAESPSARCPAQLDIGYCSFYDCYAPIDGEIELAEPGTVTIRGGSRDVELTPDIRYEEELVETPLFDGGEELTFEVEGGDGIDAHEAELAAPSPLTIIEPVLGEPIEIARLEHFPVSWTGGNGRYVQASLQIEQIVEDEVRRVGLACRYAPDAKSVVLPTELLQWLPAVTDPAEAQLSIGAWTFIEGDVPHWLYVFYATASESVGVTLR